MKVKEWSQARLMFGVFTVTSHEDWEEMWLRSMKSQTDAAICSQF